MDTWCNDSRNKDITKVMFFIIFFNNQYTTAMKTPLQMTFKAWFCYINIAHYANGRIAIQLFDVESSAPVAVATVNIPEVELDADEIIIKDHSENEGMFSALLQAGLIESTGNYAQSGYVTYPIAKMTEKLLRAVD